MKSMTALAIILIFLSAGAYSDLRGGEAGKSPAAYHGFHVDYSEVKNDPDFETMQAAMNKQLDMVLAVGVPDKMLAFFKKVPVKVLLGRESSAGHYTGKSKSVKTTSEFLLKGHKPMLLHELLHAYHDQRMPGGFKNREILTYYERAKSVKDYDSSSHMMANEKEYFASAGTAYLYGVTALEPFTRDKVKTAQPQFYKFLTSLFGPDAGNYAGTMEHK